MTHEEALEVLKGTFDPWKGVQEAIKVACDALEKQIPKKPKNIRCLGKIDMYKYGYCPKCDCGCNYEMQFCDSCGQAIDWSDKE